MYINTGVNVILLVFADGQICDYNLYLFTVKPSMPETTALGAAMAAGAAEGVSVWSLNPEDLTEVTSEKFEPQINPEGKEI